MTLEPISYLEYIESEKKYLNSEKYKKDETYWFNRFSTKPEKSYIKPYSQESSTVLAERITNIIDIKTTEKIKDFCNKSGISLAILFEAAIFVYLYKINEERKEIIIGVPVLNRTTKREKEIAGMFISTMPLTVAVTDEDTSTSLCQKISDSHLEMFRHQKYPYSEILKIIRDRHDFSGNLFDVMVSYQNAKVDCKDSVSYRTEWLHNGCSEIPLALHIDERDENGTLTVNMDYQTEIFTEQEAALLYDRIIYIISQLISDKCCTVESISVMPEREYQNVVFDFNDTSVEYPRGKCVHELFSEQAAKTPNEIALVFEDKQFTYKQLDEMSNSLAHYLCEKGITSNDIVPIISKRSWHLIVAMLGILKSGGAYIPSDPNYPDERIEYMISEAESKVALTFGFERKISIPSIKLEKYDFTNNTESIENINNPEDTCYVIFTSGSTGKPKGVIIRHYNICNYFLNNIYTEKKQRM